MVAKVLKTPRGTETQVGDVLIQIPPDMKLSNILYTQGWLNPRTKTFIDQYTIRDYEIEELGAGTHEIYFSEE